MDFDGNLGVHRYLRESLLEPGNIFGRSQFQLLGIVQTGIGKVSFDDERLLKNLAAVLDQVNKIKPAAVKGVYIRSVYLSSTMGPGIKLDLTKLEDLSKYLVH